MPIITNPSVLPNGTVGVPYSVTFIIDKQGDVSYPYVLALNTLGATPPGLDSNLFSAKNVDQDGSIFGGATQGETITGQTSGASGIYVQPGVGPNLGMQYIRLNGIGFQLGEQVDGEINGPLGLIDSAVSISALYGNRLILQPTLVPASLFDDTRWTLSGIPTTAGTYNFGLRMWNGDQVTFTGFNFQITINEAPPPTPKPTRRRNGGGVGISNIICFQKNYIEKFYPNSCRDGGIIYYTSYKIPYVFLHIDPRGNCCFKRIIN